MRRGECAWELFAESGLRLSTPDVLARELSEVTNDCVLVGDGALRYQGVFARAGSPRVCFGGAEFAAPSPRAVGAIGWAGLQSGGGLPAVEVEAIYLRAPDAKVNFETRENESADDATRGSSSRGTT
jgi:tRNA A37 threonylcarbamoyladenosine modification protein TsaB